MVCSGHFNHQVLCFVKSFFNNNIVVYIKNSITILCFFLKATVFTPQVYYLISNSMVRQKGWILNEKKEKDDALKKQFHTSLCCVNFHLKITCFQARKKE